MEDLVELQKVDRKIQQLTEIASQIPRQIEARESLLAQRHNEKDALELRKAELEKEQRSLQRNLDEKEEEKAKYKTHLPSVKTNREYKAILAELEAVDERISELEDGILHVLTNMDEVNKEIDAKEKLIKEEQAKFAQERGRLNVELEKVKETLSSCRKGRDTLATDMDAELLTRYDQIRDRKGGLAVVEVIENACSGCYMQLPPQVINEVMEGKKVIYCQSCSRILYWKGERVWEISQPS